jgi:hypothetical protein
MGHSTLFQEIPVPLANTASYYALMGDMPLATPVFVTMLIAEPFAL